MSRLVVDDEQWIYFQQRRIATLPVDLEPEFYWDPATFIYWLQFPNSPEHNLQRGSTGPHSMPERTPPNPDFLVTAPDGPDQD